MSIMGNAVQGGVCHYRIVEKRHPLRFEATAPNQVYVTDITYIPTDEGWLYPAANTQGYFHG